MTKKETRSRKAGPRTASKDTQQSSEVLVVFSIAALVSLVLVGWIVAPDVYAQVTRTASNPTQVYDSVLSETIREELHKVCSERDNDHVLFRWPFQDEPRRHNLIEQVISDILFQLEKPSKDYIVEYWVRQKWNHTVAHADLDEVFMLQQQELKHPLPERYPIQGHELYLKVGTEVNGPTVLFPNITKGGSLKQVNQDKEVLIVPAVPGRLLRFEGNLLHAVPRPANLWIRPSTREVLHEPEEKYVRSVLHFNLWPVDGPPVGRSFTIPVKEEESFLNVKENLCNDREDWRDSSISKSYQGHIVDRFRRKRVFQLPLMGPERRRGTKELAMPLKATMLVEAAFKSLNPVPKRVYLFQNTMGFLQTSQDDEL